jgi:hypothetical protein
VHKAHKAASAIAAMFDLTAIGVKDAVAKVGLRMQGGVNQQNLVTAYAKLSVCKRPGPLWGHVNRLSDAVEHHEVVARSVHFGEVPFHPAIIPYSPYQSEGIRHNSLNWHKIATVAELTDNLRSD